jgi:hypothetical protein
MGYDIKSILVLCGVGAFGFWLVGAAALLVAVRLARDEFRVKGYLRTPSGKRWFRFLLFKEYDHFANSSTRFYFGIAHFCLMAIIIVGAAIAVLIGCEMLLGGVASVPDSIFAKPTL